MTSSAGTSSAGRGGPAQAKARLLEHISRQFEEIKTRVDADVAKHAHTADSDAMLGFVLYFLKDASGEPLKDTQVQPVGIDLSEMEATNGFVALRTHCEKMYLNLRLDAHFYSDQPKLTRIYQVIVDGWT